MTPPTRLELTLSERDFLRLLPDAAGPGLRPEPGGYVVERDGWRCRIQVAPLPPLNLCRLSLERLVVELDLEGASPEAAAAFLARFRDHYRRGGG